MTKKVIVVGGGITGCIVALCLSDKGLNVEIHERASRIGGILKDLNHGEEKFFNGCQYLNPEAEWYRKYRKIFDKKIKVFKHKYGSITQNKKYIKISKEYALPIFNDNFSYSKFKVKKIKNLEDRFSVYPKKIEKFLKSLVCNWGFDSKKIDNRTSKNLNLSRVVLDGYEKLSLKLKKNKFDDLIALSRRARDQNQEFKAAIPKDGYDDFFKSIKKKLEKNKVKIFFKSNIEPTLAKNKIKITSYSKNVNADFVIWTGDPTLLVQIVLKKKLDSLHQKILQLSFNCKGINKDYIYYQFFSNTEKILRFFKYTIGNKSKVSIEMIYDKKINLNKIFSTMQKIFFNLKIQKKNIYKNLGLRYNIISVNDGKLLDKLEKSKKIKNLICSPFAEHGRDLKIEHILKKFNKLCPTK